MITVDEIMTTDLHTLPETASLADAIKLMGKKHIHHLPIVDGKGRLVGLVSHRDVLAATDSTLRAKGERQDPARIAISKIMTRNVATVDEHASLRQAARYLEKHRYGCLPVVTNGKLRGIVTDSDFLAVAINLLEQVDDREAAGEYQEVEPPDEL